MNFGSKKKFWHDLHEFLAFLKVEQADHQEDDAAECQEDTAFDKGVLPDHGVYV